MVEQAARVPSSRGRARELLRNSLRSFSDPDPAPNDAAWPPLRCGQTARSADRPRVRNLVEPSGALVARGADRGPGVFYRQPAGPLYNKKRQRGGAIAIYASRKPWFGQPSGSSGRLTPRAEPPQRWAASTMRIQRLILIGLLSLPLVVGCSLSHFPLSR